MTLIAVPRFFITRIKASPTPGEEIYYKSITSHFCSLDTNRGYASHICSHDSGWKAWPCMIPCMEHSSTSSQCVDPRRRKAGVFSLFKSATRSPTRARAGERPRYPPLVLIIRRYVMARRTLVSKSSAIAAASGRRRKMVCPVNLAILSISPNTQRGISPSRCATTYLRNSRQTFLACSRHLSRSEGWDPARRTCQLTSNSVSPVRGTRCPTRQRCRGRPSASWR